MRAAIYGAGAMGTVLGAYITKNGGSIDLISRNREHIAALRSGGAHIVGEAEFTVPVKAYLPEEMEGEYDVIFLMTKQRHNAEILKFLSPYLAEDGVVCTTQNGLPEPLVGEIVGKERCCGCAVSWGATFLGKGSARLTTRTDALEFALGTIYGNCNRLEDVRNLLSLMGKVTVEENFVGARWSKLTINCAFSGISALTGLTFGQICDNKYARKVAQAVLKECFDMAKVCGIRPAKVQGHNVERILGYRGPFTKWLSYMIIPLAMKKHRDIISGMYCDLAAGRLCEIDFINGAALAYAKKKGADGPLNSIICNGVHEIERGERTISPKNLELFKNLV